MLLHSKFDGAEIEKEKGVILEEMNVYLDTPQRYVGNVYDRLLYADQPLGWDIIGTRETVEAATRETFRSYLDTWYRPERMVVGIGGRLGDGLTDRLEELLGGIERRPTGEPREVELPPERITRPPAHQGLGAGAPHPRRPRISRSATRTATRSSCSRSCSAAGCRRGSSPRFASGAASATTCTRGTAPTRTRAPSTRARASTSRGSTRRSPRSSASCARSRPSRVPAEELEKARGYSKGRFVLRLESPQGTIQYGLRREVLEGEIEDPDELLRRLDEVTVEDVQRVARDLFEDKRLYLAIVGPFDDPARFEALLAA